MAVRCDADAALRLIPGGSSTMAKSPLRAFPPQTPSLAVSAEGATFVDEQDRTWIDCDMALGAVIWGYGRREINDAIAEQLRRGQIFSVPAMIEIELAERLLDRLGAFEAVRFCKDGADAVAAAVRIARAATGRDRVAAGTYHGWLDWSAYHHYAAEPRLGVPRAVGELTAWLPEQTFAACERSGIETCAAVIVCPEQWSGDDLRLLRAACTSAATLLVFDEVKAGMRWGKRGVFGEVGVQPDLLCLSKGLANGLALAALTGPRELMRYAEVVRFSSTHAGECLPIAAAIAGERLLGAHSVWPSWRDRARAMMSGLERVAATRELIVAGGPGLFSVRPSAGDSWPAFRAHFIRSLAAEGIFTTGSIALSDAHSEAQTAAIAAAADRAVRAWDAGQFSRK